VNRWHQTNTPELIYKDFKVNNVISILPINADLKKQSKGTEH